MPPRQAAYLWDILLSSEAIQSYLAGYDRERFLADGKTQDAVLRRLLVIGEAAARLTPQTCDLFPALPFRQIVGMRNRILHDYGHLDLEIVWTATQEHLDSLTTSLKAFFREHGELDVSESL